MCLLNSVDGTRYRAAEEGDVHCRQAIVDNHRWVGQWSQSPRPLPHVHGGLLGQLPAGSLLNLANSFAEVKEAVKRCGLQTSQFCYAHNAWCKTSRPVDIDFSSLPCSEKSPADHRLTFLESGHGPLYAVWAEMHKAHRTKLVILEATPESCAEFISCAKLVLCSTPPPPPSQPFPSPDVPRTFFRRSCGT